MNTTSSETVETTLVSPVTSRKIKLTPDELRTLIEDDTHDTFRGVVVIATSLGGTSYRIEGNGPSRNHLFNGNTIRVRPAMCLYKQRNEQEKEETINENMLVSVTNQESPALRFHRSAAASEDENLEHTVNYSRRQPSEFDTSSQLVEIFAVIYWAKVGT